MNVIGGLPARNESGSCGPGNWHGRRGAECCLQPDTDVRGSAGSSGGGARQAGDPMAGDAGGGGIKLEDSMT